MRMLFIFVVVLLAGCHSGGGSSAPIPDTPQPVDPPQPTNGITIGWTIPSMRVEGDPLSLSEIKHYDVYVAENLFWIPPIPTDTVTENTYTITQPGTYYVYVTTVDMNNDSSPYSDPLKVEVQ